MKGLVFTEFVEFVEKSHGLDVADRMINESNVASRGVYTAVGTYPHQEMVALLTTLVGISKTPAPALLQAFGKHLLTRFVAGYPGFFSQTGSVFKFLQSVHGHIHVEVRKLYPDAELPSFSYEQPTPDVLKMTYSSSRGLADLAEGLIRGAIDHYGEAIGLLRADGVPGPQSTLFTLTRQPA